MVKKLFLAFFMVLGVLLADEIENISTKLNDKNEIEAKRAYVHIKNIYIQAILQSDEPTIQKTGKILREFGAKFGDDEFIKENHTGSEEKKDATKVSILGTQTKVTDIEFSNETLTITLNEPIYDEKIRRFIIPDNGTGIIKYVFDIKAVLVTKQPKIVSSSVENIRVAQFDKQTTRVVFHSKNELNIALGTGTKELLFEIGAQKGESKKSIAKKPTTSEPQKIETKIAPPARKRTIVIDPGHGGHDCGTISPRKVCEKKIVLNVAKIIQKELKKIGYEAILTRNTDTFIKLKDRTSFANKKSADAFLSIHVNAAPNMGRAAELSGIETFFLSTGRSERAKDAAALENKEDIEDMNYFSKEIYLEVLNSKRIIESNKLAIDIHKNALETSSTMKKVVDNGVREGPFWVLVGAQMPSILIELGYLSHEEESKYLEGSKYQSELAAGIAKGVDEYFKKLSL